eukprot:scaffold34818_cov68-Phaeocystis_antarctica.AAC.6
MELIRTYDEVRPLAQPPPLHRRRPANPPSHAQHAHARASLFCHTHGSHEWLRYVSAQKKREMEAKTRTYRLLHLELQSIKQAVKTFVDARNAH